MSSHSERLERHLRSLYPHAAEIDAMVEKALADPSYKGPAWLDRGPDPFGQNWAWEEWAFANADQAEEATSRAEPESDDLLVRLAEALPAEMRDEFRTAYPSASRLPPPALFSLADQVMRAVAVANGAAARLTQGPVAGLMKNWSESGFVSLCVDAGEPGKEFLNRLANPNVPADPSLVPPTVNFLRTLTAFEKSSVSDLTVIALALISAFKSDQGADTLKQSKRTRQAGAG